MISYAPPDDHYMTSKMKWKSCIGFAQPPVYVQFLSFEISKNGFQHSVQDDFLMSWTKDVRLSVCQSVSQSVRPSVIDFVHAKNRASNMS